MFDMARTATTRQVATALHVTESTVQTYSRDSRIPFDRTPGGHRRYDIDEVRASLRVGDPSALAPMVSSGLGAGAEFRRSEMAMLDTERRAVVGETIVDTEHGRAEAAPVGRRYNRPAHSDQLELHVLGKAGDKISKLAVQYATSDKPTSHPPEVLLVGAAREWLIGGTERHVEINVVVDAKSTQAVGMYDTTNAVINEAQITSAARKLARVLASTIPADKGYVITVKPITLDGISAGEFLALEPWLWADAGDPLADV
jgi:DNA-binding transcriptional MerR regulator